ncbi:ABC transporter ATP-binding protein [Candidatus Bathyarchaeota archaeon]|nr:ABC transporter ATP-binding protein [Candidatus Bathyarchaeota archaeon]
MGRALLKSLGPKPLDLAIETIDLTKRYGSLVAVNRLNLRVGKGTIHGFLGPNGAGKTTTIKILVGLLKPDGGRAIVLGEEVHGDNPRSRLKIGYMPELPKFPRHLKGWELLDIYGQMYGMPLQERRTRIKRLMELVGLKGRENDLIGEYSKGMQQRLGIAQALLSEPELVILDEPSLGLDPVGMVEVREIIREIAREGVTVFLSSHLLSEVEQVCTHISIIHRGVCLAEGPLKDIISKISGSAILEVEVAETPDKIVEAVKRLPFVSNIHVEGSRVIIETNANGDVRPQISRAIIEAGGTIIYMNLRMRSLEETFMRLIMKSR